MITLLLVGFFYISVNLAVGFHGSLSDSKFPQVSKTLLCILFSFLFFFFFMVFHWNLSDKFPQVTKTFLLILN